MKLLNLMIGLLFYFIGGCLQCAVTNHDVFQTAVSVPSPSREMQKWFADSMKPHNRYRYAMACVALSTSDVFVVQGSWKVPLQQRLNVSHENSVSRVVVVPENALLVSSNEQYGVSQVAVSTPFVHVGFGCAVPVTSNQQQPCKATQKRQIGNDDVLHVAQAPLVVRVGYALPSFIYRHYGGNYGVDQAVVSTPSAVVRSSTAMRILSDATPRKLIGHIASQRALMDKYQRELDAKERLLQTEPENTYLQLDVDDIKNSLRYCASALNFLESRLYSKQQPQPLS